MKAHVAIVFVLVILAMRNDSPGQGKVEDEVLRLLQSVEFKDAEQEKLDAFGKDVVVILTSLLERQSQSLDGGRAVAVLAPQYRRYEQLLDESQKTRALTAIVATARRLQGDNLIQAIYAMKGLNSPVIRGFASELRQDSREEVRTAAQSVLSSIGSDSAEMSRFPAKPAEVSPPPPADVKPAAATPTTSTPAPPLTPIASPASMVPVPQTPAPMVERKSPVWPWLVGMLALVVIIAFALKRRA
jgi:hypothetical protein